MPWPPIPPSASVIDLPADQYLHRGAPTEWWWHTGTLVSTLDQRVFGFEINAASFEGQGGIGFSQVMLTDVAAQAHYQRTCPYLPPLNFLGSTWAEFDPTKDWRVQLGNPDNYLSTIDVVNPGSGYTSEPNVKITGADGGELAFAWPTIKDGQVSAIWLLSPGVGFKSAPTVTISGGGGSGATAKAVHTYVTMNAPWGQALTNMSVKALLNDQATGTEIMFDLTLSQAGPPFIVWGTGFQPMDPSGKDHLHQNNYYYSLTRLNATGTITVGSQAYPVTGVTWMDHEYGAFGSGSGPKWLLQDMQLSNGVHISNSTGLTAPPPVGVPFDSHATVQRADGTTYLVPSKLTLSANPQDQWTSPVTHKTYFWKNILVEIPQFGASLTVSSLMPGQEFPVAGSPVYEGVSVASGKFEGKEVSGTAWNEQAPLATAK